MRRRRWGRWDVPSGLAATADGPIWTVENTLTGIEVSAGSRMLALDRTNHVIGTGRTGSRIGKTGFTERSGAADAGVRTAGRCRTIDMISVLLRVGGAGPGERDRFGRKNCI